MYLYRGSRCYVRGRVDTSGHFFIVSNHKVFTMLLFARVRGLFWQVKKVSFVKNAFVFYHKCSKSLGLCVKMNMCAFTHGPPKNTTLHHPSTHSDNDTYPEHNKSRQLLTHLDQSRNRSYPVCGCALLNLCWSTREWVVAALGRRWT